MDDDDEADLKKAAKLTLAYSEAEMDKLVGQGTLVEVNRGDEDEAEQDVQE